MATIDRQGDTGATTSKGTPLTAAQLATLATGQAFELHGPAESGGRPVISQVGRRSGDFAVQTINEQGEQGASATAVATDVIAALGPLAALTDWERSV